MSIFNLLTFGVKTAANIYQTRRETKQLEAKAERNHVERMVNGEVYEYLTEKEWCDKLINKN